MPTFEIGAEDFLLDGRPFQVISGALHYFRVHPGQWRDRIEKARLMGLNTIETYVAWNAHAPRRGRFDLDGGLDLGRFLDLVAAAGLRAIVRPGPYICAEWDNGGLPAWLFTEPGTGVRRNEPTFLARVTEYLEALAPVLVPRQVASGGPVILVQVENEYGAYGSDADYLRHLVSVMRGSGITVPLTTVDQPTDEMLAAGGLPELHRTASFGSRPHERLESLRRHQASGPLMCSEFWNGWFDSWGEHHHVTDARAAADDLDAMLSTGASVNLYMFHGGTNFGARNGANDKGVYRPIATSYDYDAPLDEAGNPTEKYWAFRDVLRRHTAVPDEEPPPAKPGAQFELSVAETLRLEAVLEELGEWSRPGAEVSMDDVGHYRGCMLYRTDLPHGGVLHLGEVRDRVQVLHEGRPLAVLAREMGEQAVAVPSGGRLDLLVEDLGRVNYGPRIGEPKGIIGPSRLDGEVLGDWLVLPIDLDRIPRVVPGHPGATIDSGRPAAGPVFATARFDHPGGDLFLSTRGWGEGIAWVNGFCLGRYWSRGPQRTLYVPGPALRERGNVLVLFEQHVAPERVRFVAGLELGHTEA